LLPLAGETSGSKICDAFDTPGFVVSQVVLKLPTITLGPLLLDELNGAGPKLFVVLLILIMVTETAIVMLPKIAVIIATKVFDIPPGAAPTLRFEFAERRENMFVNEKCCCL